MASIIGNIVIALIALTGTIMSAQIKKSSDVLIYRLEVVEHKIDKQDNLEKDLILLKEQLKVANHRINDLEEELKK